MVSYKELGLVNSKDLFKKAIEGGYAIPAFNFNNMEQLQAIVSACVETKSPVIMQVSSGARKYANQTLLRYMAQGAVEYAKELVRVPELIQKLVKARRKLTKQEPENLKESISQLLLKRDIALEKNKFILARENYYQALTESHVSGQLDLTLWAWQKVLKLGLAQQHFTLAAKAFFSEELISTNLITQFPLPLSTARFRFQLNAKYVS